MVEASLASIFCADFLQSARDSSNPLYFRSENKSLKDEIKGLQLQLKKQKAQVYFEQ